MKGVRKTLRLRNTGHSSRISVVSKSKRCHSWKSSTYKTGSSRNKKYLSTGKPDPRVRAQGSSPPQAPITYQNKASSVPEPLPNLGASFSYSAPAMLFSQSLQVTHHSPLLCSNEGTEFFKQPVQDRRLLIMDSGRVDVRHLPTPQDHGPGPMGLFRDVAH